MNELECTFACPTEEWGALVSDFLRQGKTVRLRAKGISMSPAIRDGEVVWMAPVAAQDLNLGQVVFYTNIDGRPVIHRVVYWQQVGGEESIGIAADRPTASVEWVPPEQVLGRVIAIERAGRRIALDGPLGWLSGWFWLLLRPLRPLLGRLRGWMRRLGGQVHGAWWVP